MIILLLALQDDLWKFKEGTRWTYSEKWGEVTRKSVRRVVKSGKDRVEFEVEEYAEDAEEPERTTKAAAFVEEGFVIWDDGTNKFRLFKTGAKKGDTWKTRIGREEIELEYVGTRDVRVPAGEYKDAHQIRYKFSGPDKKEVVADYYLAPGVGPVKMIFRTGTEVVLSSELEEFKK